MEKPRLQNLSLQASRVRITITILAELLEFDALIANPWA